MSGEPEVTHTPDEETEEEIKSTYKPPPEKTIEEILAADQEDESLRKYKEALLGQAQAGAVVVDHNDPRKVIVKKLALCVTGRDDLELDLSGDLTDLKKQVFVIKEGVQYRIRIDFIVQREIVHGLKYVQKTYRLGVPGSLVVLASSGRSPHADYVEEYLKTKGAGRYSDNVIEDALLDIPELVAKYGYPFEAHTVITTDGYILEVHRIRHGRDQNNTPDPDKPVAFLMHGLYSSSANFIVLGPGNALAYILAEAGFDVWLGNARGNYYSRHHQTLNPDGRKGNLDFWMFSWDEIGNLDLPVIIDYILVTTGQSKLHYLGHSQGGTTFLVLNSLRPEYNEKFHSFQALAPAAFFIYNEDFFYQIASPLEAVIEETMISLGVFEILGNREFFTWFSLNFCVDGFTADICNGILYRGDPEYYNTTMTPLLLGHAPAGSSARQMTHYGQSINTKKFRRFNHLPIKNIEVYGYPTPPDYDLEKITVPTYLHYGYADEQADYRDINYLGDRLPNVAGRFPVPRESFNHLDFIWGVDAKEQLYDKLVEIMLRYH